MDETILPLIDRCRQGSKAAQLALYKRYAQKLYIACLRIVGNRMEAEEAMQDTFLKVFSKLDQYCTDQNFEVWMHRITVHTAIDYVRKQTREWEEIPANFAEPAQEEEPDEEAIQYTVEQVKATVQKLPPGYRIVLTLYLFEGYDMEEIASILKIQPPSVRTQYLRAKRKLLDIITVR
jgi:RNA polymerase sigma-70 factor (ECF subfamily)